MKKEIEIEVSARHIHFSKNDFELLFGKDTSFEQLHELSQSGEFSTDKKVEIVGPKGKIEARFLSPFRERTQVELSATDCFSIGVEAPYEIDAFKGAASIKIRGPQGEIERKSAIVAKRHLHANPIEAEYLGITEGQQLSIVTQTERGTVYFKNVTVKIKKNFHLRVHLDTDEGNAAGIKGSITGELIV